MGIQKTVSRLARAGAIGLIGAVLAAGPASAQPKSVPVLSCPYGCGPITADTILMNQMILAGFPVILLPQETPGYMYNIREMAKEKHWKRTIFGTEDHVIQLALKGGSPALKEFLPEPINIKFKLLYGEAWWAQGRFFMTFDPSIKSIADLKGKSISIGLRSQSDFGLAARLFLEYGYGITMKNSDIRHMTPSAMTQQLIDGATTAATGAFAAEPHLKNWLIGGTLRQLEAVGKPLTYLGIGQEVTDKINKKFGTTFESIVVPAGTLPGQTKDFSVAVNHGYKAAHPSFPEETAYQIVMAVAKLGEKMKKLHPMWEIWSPELMLYGLSEENAHPGAIRAYKELGWWDIATKKYADKAVTYPE